MRLFLLLVGWTLFGVSLLLPAVRTSGFFGFFGGPFPGWVCFGASVLGIGGLASGELRATYLGLVGLSNLLMLASLALGLWGERWDAPQRHAFLAAAVVVCLSKHVGHGPNTEYLVGYYVWCASFLAVAAALQFKR